MIHRPGSEDLGQMFSHRGVAAAYEHRPPYPPEVFEILDDLVVDEPRRVLDVGTGEGALARPLAARFDVVDAVDVSAEMLDAGQRRPGGDQPNLHWILGAIESAPLTGPYALVTAGASLHWMHAETTMRRLAEVMTPKALLAVVEQDLFTVTGTAVTFPMRFRQPVAHYVEHFHSTASLAREHMTQTEAAEFVTAIEQITAPWAQHGVLELDIVAKLSWGRPRR